MRTNHLILAVLAALTLLVSACATQATAVATNTSARSDPGARRGRTIRSGHGKHRQE